jgi:hypothetical protein
MDRSDGARVSGGVTLAELQAQMDAAAARQDFEEARRLRDLIALARQTGADPDAIVEADLQRQQPGAMGIGTSVARPTRPEGWVKPKRPDPLTRNTGRKRGR